MDLPKRKPHHLPEYLYQSGAYFVTVCTDKRKPILSRIVVGQGLAPAVPELTVYGRIVEKQLLSLETRFRGLKIDKYVIMPNHVHAIIFLENPTAAGASPRPTVSSAICAFKSLSTLQCKRQHPIDKVFQNSYYDHIIRNQNDYDEIWTYIDNNPQKWELDKLYIL